MKIALLLSLFIAFPAAAEVLEISPRDTDMHITQEQGPHLAYFDSTAKGNGYLLISLAGTSSKPSNLSVIDERAVKQGYNVLAIDYPNSVISTVCRQSTDPKCSEKFRREIVNGEPVATDPNVKVDKTNSIENRIRALLRKMNSGKDAARWAPYLKKNGEVDWSKIVVMGHSQGSGHAAFLAKNHRTQGAIIIAGPQDTSENFGPASWLKEHFATDKKDLLFFMHADDYFQFGKQDQLNTVKAILGSDAAITDAANPRGDAQILMSRTHAGEKSYDAHIAIISKEYEKQFDYLLKRIADETPVALRDAEKSNTAQ